MAAVEFKKVRKSFGNVDVIPELDLAIKDSSFTVLVGPSGCGKSTLLRMIAGLETTSSGALLIGGEDVTRRDPSDRGIAMVFQSYALYPHMSVADNIGFGLKLAGLPKAEIEKRVLDAAGILQLTKLLDRKPRQLSGGQRQRVAIGRAIVRQPKVFLFDEPLSNLDAALRSQMRVELTELHERIGATMIYVTHDQVEAMTMADQIVVLNSGRIEQIGTPAELYRQPQTPFVAGFIGSPRMNFIEGSFAKSHGVDIVGMRPEDIVLSATGGQWKARIRHSEFLGSETLVYADADDIGLITVKSPGEMTIAQGEMVYVNLDLARAHAFRAGHRVEAVST
jgi:ABC-type sugar transport system ATPase subunit